jgi:hypothetical protein
MTTAVATLIKMIETLPEPAQERLVDRIREYLADIQDELEWEQLVQKTQPQLIQAARKAKQEIAAGLSQPLEPNQL